jgi:hypothetical protein
MTRKTIYIFATYLFVFVSINGCTQYSPEDRYNRAMDMLRATEGAEQRYYVLPDAAKAAMDAGKTDEAYRYAQELKEKMKTLDRGNGMHYGNAWYDSNIVLGRVALAKGDVGEAKRYLIEAGSTPGSPQLDLLGPNMALAKELLEKGEREVVLQFFALCGQFWKNGRQEKLPKWAEIVTNGGIPNFGNYLFY